MKLEEAVKQIGLLLEDHCGDEIIMSNKEALEKVVAAAREYNWEYGEI